MCNNINYVTRNSLCTGCGLCEDVCPRQCITIKRKKGEYRPFLDSSKCIGDKCGRCLKVCPGVGDESLKDYCFETNLKTDCYVGPYKSIYSGYSLDNDIRLHSASGGLVTQFIVFLLEKKIVDGAVITSFDEDKITPYSFIATSREEVIKGQSSKYCPVALNKIGNEILKQEEGKKFVIVGTPCHILGFRKRMFIERRFKDKVVGLFSLYCSSQRTFYSQDFLLKHYHVNKKDIDYFSYRDNGCLGNLTIQRKNGTVVSVPYTEYYGPLLRSFFKPHRCLTCIDHYGTYADICFGDLHIAPYDSDKVGISSWIVRSEKWNNLLKQAASEGYIRMDEIEPVTLNNSQKNMLFSKKEKASAVMFLDRLVGKKKSVYKTELPDFEFKHLFSVCICHFQRFIGRHSRLWWIIELLSKR